MPEKGEITMKCPKCGKDVGDSKFCPYCGEKIEEDSQLQAENVENKSENSQVLKKHKRINVPAIIAISIAGAFLIGIAGVANMKTPTSHGVQSSSQISSESSSSDTADSDSLLDSDDYGDTNSLEDSSDGTSSLTSSQEALIRNAFIGDCKIINYKSIARDPQKYVGKAVKFKGQVQQVIDEGPKKEALMVYVDPDDDGIYQDPIYVTHAKDNSESRILEKDILTMYGTGSQLQTYTTVMGDERTIPGMLADYIVVNSK